MPACPTRSFTLTYKEWNLGNCTSCSSPLRDLSKTRDPNAAANKSTADTTIPPAARPGGDTVRTGLLLIIVAIGLFWLSLIGLFYGASASEGMASETARPFLISLQFFSGMAIVTSIIIALTGAILCAVMPSQTPARFTALAAGLMPLLWIGAWVFSQHMKYANVNSEGRMIFEHD